MKVLLTGTGGLLGSELVKWFISCNDVDKIFALTSDKNKTSKKFDSKKVIVVDNDSFLSNPKQIVGTEPFSVIHCAFARSLDTFLLAQSMNFTECFFRCLRNTNCSRIILISSQSVYQQKGRDFYSTEDSPIGPCDIYGLAKYSQELLLNAIFFNTDVQYTTVRLSSILHNCFVDKFVDMTITGKPLTITAPNRFVSYMSIADAVCALSKLLFAQMPLAQCYNLGSGVQYSILAIAELAQEIGAKSFGLPNPGIIVQDSGNSGAICMDISKLSEKLHWKPKDSLERMISDCYDRRLNAT